MVGSHGYMQNEHQGRMYSPFLFFSFFITISFMSQPPHSSTQFPAAKWIQNDNDDSDSDQVGLVPHNRGYKHILFF